MIHNEADPADWDRIFSEAPRILLLPGSTSDPAHEFRTLFAGSECVHCGEFKRR